MSAISIDRESVIAACLFLVTFLLIATAIPASSDPARAAAPEGSEIASLSTPQTQPTIPNGDDDEPLEEALDVDLRGAPSTFCPGHTLYYTLVMTNVRQGPVHNLIISHTLPDRTCCPENGNRTTIPFTETVNSLLWYTDTLPVGQPVTVELLLHSFGSIVTGDVLTSSFSIDSEEIAPGKVAVGLTADSSECEATATPTNTPTPTPTATTTPTTTPTPSPTPTLTKWENVLYLPLIFH